MVERMPEPLEIMPTFATCDEDGMISVHGFDNSDEVSAFSIDTNARTSFTSLRGILDLIYPCFTSNFINYGMEYYRRNSEGRSILIFAIPIMA